MKKINFRRKTQFRAENTLPLLPNLEAIEGIKSGLESMKHGKGRPADEVLQRLANKFEIPVE